MEQRETDTQLCFIPGTVLYLLLIIWSDELQRLVLKLHVSLKLLRWLPFSRSLYICKIYFPCPCPPPSSLIDKSNSNKFRLIQEKLYTICSSFINKEYLKQPTIRPLPCRKFQSNFLKKLERFRIGKNIYILRCNKRVRY